MVKFNSEFKLKLVLKYLSGIGSTSLNHEYGIKARKGTCLDNAQMESFFHIMKSEMMNVHYDTKKSLIHAMKAWIKDYNENRIKEKLGYQSPNQYLGLIS